MFSIFSRSVGIAALSVVVLGLAACGESSEEKATKQACAATSEIKAQVKKLGTLPISSSFVTEVKTSAEAIDKNASNEKARRLLGWAPRSPREAILATARSLSELGLLKAA